MMRTSRRSVCHELQSHRHDTRIRSGWTLIEMLVTIAVIATITGVAVKTLAAMLRSERNGVEHVARLATISRLARQFRADIHKASAIEISTDTPSKPLLLVTVNETQQIQYETKPAGLLRTERRANQQPSIELWRLAKTRFQCVESNGPPRMLTLVIGTLEPDPIQGSSPTGTSKELRLDAVVGRDRPK
jgi:prepilin-type N-terminal cleavage/methylation domain-containing protein